MASDKSNREKVDIMAPAEHQQVHQNLASSAIELMEDYVWVHPGAKWTTTSFADLMLWATQQAIKPDHPFQTVTILRRGA